MTIIQNPTRANDGLRDLAMASAIAGNRVNALNTPITVTKARRLILIPFCRRPIGTKTRNAAGTKRNPGRPPFSRALRSDASARG